MELKDIKRIMQMMKENDVTEFAMEDEDFVLELSRGIAGAAQVIAAPQMVAAPVAAAAAVSAPEAPVADETDGLVEITSPMVGTFYRSPSPEADMFTEIGASITEDSVVCIVEAMKVMNEIQADVKGTIKKILVENATPVQFGQPLFLVDPA